MSYSVDFTYNVDAIKHKLKQVLTPKRFKHSLGAEAKARELAKRFNVDQDRAALAALLHDNAKCYNKEQLLAFAKDNDVPIPDNIDESPGILHSFVGEFIAEEEFGINDVEILKAIRNHTLGAEDMSPLEIIVYIADKTEEFTREGSYYKSIKQVLKNTNSLEETMLYIMGRTIIDLVERNAFIHPSAAENWNLWLRKTSKEPLSKKERYINGNLTRIGKEIH